MTQIIIIAILAVLLGLTILGIGWLLWSKSRKRLIEQAKKEAKQTRKQVVAAGYREVSEMKHEFQKEYDQWKNQIKLEDQRLQAYDSLLEKNQSLSEIREKRLDGYEIALEKRNKEYEQKRNDLILMLEKISGMSQDEAKKALLDQIKMQSSQEINSYLKNAQLEAHAKAKTLATNIVVQAMESYATEIVNEKTANIIKLPNEEIKGRIIGKEGRNIKAFEQFGGVDILIDESPGIVTVSSFNPIRREIATRTLEKMLVDGRIQPSRIEQELNKQSIEMENIMLKTGEEVVYELGILDMDLELVKLVGKLKYRTSYGQSVLMHSIEVAKIAGAIAAELGLNVKQAIRAGLLHDIGKAVDFEQEGSHVMLGVEAAKKYGEDEVIVNAIAAHHEDVAKDSLIAAIVAIADAISASRPGGRNNTVADFFKRMKEIETICNEIPGVDKTYALQSGRQIRVIVDPNLVGDQDLTGLMEKVKTAITKNVVIPGEITITMIREVREVKLIK